MRSSIRAISNNPLLFFFGAIFLIVLFRSAWVSEDAYITLRTVDNFVNGYGLRWNVSERVQTYTHPMWLFLLSAIYFFMRQGLYAILTLCMTLSFGAFLLVGKLVKRHTLATLAILSILIFSKAFIDFSTSGLENPLTHLLLASFLVVFLGETAFDRKKIILVSLIAGLSTFNRMDTILIFVPAILLILFKSPKWETARWIMLGFLPFILWEIFSIIYYGFPFPNTAYAKINTLLPRKELIEAGVLYFINSIHWDPISLLTVGAAISLAIFHGDWRERSLAAGIILYFCYVVWIGADYMSGRFISGAVLIAVGLLIRQFAQLRISESIFLFAFVIIFGFISPTPTLTSIDDASYSTGRMNINNTIRDERSFYFQPAGLLYLKPDSIEPYHEWAVRGLAFRNSNKDVYVFGGIGFIGYFAGPKLHIIDPLGLGDALIARINPVIHHRAGHDERKIPAGYEESIEENTNAIQDPNLALYYEKLRLIIQGDIWSLQRWDAIWKMNTGQYDYLLRAYQP